jgi:regulatory protein
MQRPRLSLKGRALAWLAQREHSRAELRRKLMRVARAEAAERTQADAAERAQADAAEPGAPGLPDTPDALDAPGDRADPTDRADRAATRLACDACVDALLDWLQRHGHLSEERFIESRVHARAARYGNLRIRQELAQHGVTPDEATARQLRDSEFERALAVWQRKFGQTAADPAARARQIRFLAQRGFSAEVVRRVVRADDD